MRKALFEELQNTAIFSEGEILLETYEAFLKSKLSTANKPPAARLMSPNATVFVRTDKRDFTLNSTLGILKKHFSEYKFNRLVAKVIMSQLVK